jgi:hypothetical protein
VQGGSQAPLTKHDCFFIEDGRLCQHFLSAGSDGDLPLLNPVKGAILLSENAGNLANGG